MSLITSPELFINQKSIPDQNSVEYDAFFLNELDKITYGTTINGVYIHGWLYWHINHWRIAKDIKDTRNNDIIRGFGNPDFRDNEWIIAEHVKLAEEQQKGLMIFGSRRLGKSVFETSWTGRGSVIYQGSENVISSCNSQDLTIISTLLEKGLTALHPFFKHPRIADDWTKQVIFGYKDKKTGERSIYSQIAVRNLSGGKATEAFAGLTPKTFIIDEVGKEPFGLAFESAKPAFTTSYGWRCVPILTGTGGTLGVNTDAEKYFTNPEANNFLAVEIPNKKKKYGLFLSGLKRMEGKVETTLGTFLKNERGILLPEDSELNSLPFFTTDNDKAKAKIQEELDAAIKNLDPKAYLKQRMYFPEDPDDCFLTDSGNDFPIEALKEHLAYLETAELKQDWVELYRTGTGKVDWKPCATNMKPIMDFPVTRDTIKSAPIIIWEHPEENIPNGLYIAGADPYNQAQSKNSESLGTMYIYKRMHDPAGGTFQDSIVAAIASRPETMRHWHEDVEMLLEYYNAQCMPENEGGTFVQYFDQKHKSHLLVDGYSFLKSITPNTSITGRVKGLPATIGVINYCMNLALDYTKEEIQVGTHPETNEPIMKLGLVRITDPMLVKEMIAYNKSDGNYDRLVAFRHALACNVYFNKIYPVIKFKPEQEEKQNDFKPIKSPFHLSSINPFQRRWKS